MRRVSQQQTYAGLLGFRNQHRQHMLDGIGQRHAPNLPTISGSPFGVVDVAAPERSPYIPASYFSAAIKKRSGNARCCELRVVVYPSLGDDLEGSLAFDEAREPRPFDVGCHAKIIAQYAASFNPAYAEMARQRIHNDAPLFTEVA